MLAFKELSLIIILAVTNAESQSHLASWVLNSLNGIYLHIELAGE